ncbi:MAG: hypothetical protein R2834_06070 [Rhodothermales bacterium]
MFAQDAVVVPMFGGETVKLPSQPARVLIRSTSKTLTFTYPLRGPHALNLTGEFFRAASLPRAYYKMAGIDPDWKFYSYPLTFAYSYLLPVRSTRFLPVFTAGVTAHFTRAYRLMDAAHRPIGPQIKSETDRDVFYDRSYGLGYGAEVSIGFRTVLNPHLFLLTQCRYRLVHSTPFGRNAALGMHFSVVDFALGAGFTL